mmetsp:Transcript_47087/g.113144  ORF Transcript_47087/g.113144 Transcript_47087/m.113144 type:complete len:101 (-) Transcript_47087:103-405(-)
MDILSVFESRSSDSIASSRFLCSSRASVCRTANSFRARTIASVPPGCRKQQQFDAITSTCGGGINTQQLKTILKETKDPQQRASKPRWAECDKKKQVMST